MGRPRTFDMEEAVERAMNLFWEKGYQAANLPDLLAEMGIVRGSFYKAFGSKKEVFLRALALYDQRFVQPAVEMLTDDSAEGLPTIQKVFASALQRIQQGDARGCLLCNSAAETAFHDEEIAEAVNRQLDGLTNAFEAALLHDPKWSETSRTQQSAKAQSLTQSYVGLRIMQRGGRSADQLGIGIEEAFAHP